MFESELCLSLREEYLETKSSSRIDSIAHASCECQAYEFFINKCRIMKHEIEV